MLPADVQPVILTGEWIPENLLLIETSNGWKLAAVIDFGDVMRRRLTTLMMLHGASDMRGIAIPDWQSSVKTLGDLEDLIWPRLRPHSQ